jgi:hypothetical protein
VRALVVYESMFGNTRAIAAAIAEGLEGADVEVELVEVGTAPAAPDADVGLLVVGGPTHALSLSRPESRSSAAEQAEGEPLVSQGIGLREWLAALPAGRLPSAAFDTHADKRVPGAASRAANKRLRRKGYRAVLPPESFYVSGTAGPLVDGELERARGWGARLAAEVPLAHV